jgi:hypothetical protein
VPSGEADLEQLEFVETRAANARQQGHQTRLDDPNIEPAARAHAKKLLVNLEEVQGLLETWCKTLRQDAPSFIPAVQSELPGVGSSHKG